jgi:RHS repeat-associated protein
MTISGICTTIAYFSRSLSTGKERDSESGNDYFGARYYASSMGRFMSPDWSAKEDPVPYAQLADPQSLNLYSYVRNNPMDRVDPDGHWTCTGENAKGSACQAMAAIHAQNGLVVNGVDTLASAAAAREAQQPARAQAQYNNDVPIIANQLGVSKDEVLGSVHIKKDSDGNAVVMGGHVNMTVDSSSDAQQALEAKLGKHRYNEDPKSGVGQGSEFSRLGDTPSVHLDHGLLHVDRFNAGAWGGLGVVPHFFYDVVYGGIHGNDALLPY